MKQLLIKLPLPVSAVGLSFAGLANLLDDTFFFKSIFTFLSMVILIAVFFKIFIDPKEVKSQLSQVTIAATFPTFFMGIALLTKQIIQWNTTLALVLWGLATVGHILFILYFTATFAMKKKLSFVLPSWFVVYVGLVASAITAPLFKLPILIFVAKIILGFGFISFIILLPIIIRRSHLLPIPKPLQATLAIFSAPVALNLVGYFSVIQNKQAGLIFLQIILMLVFYLWVLSNIITFLKADFSPAQAALTFPMVISATAIKVSSAYLITLYPFLKIFGLIISYLSLLIAIFIVFAILAKYLSFIFSVSKT
ncbi:MULTISPECIES: hypothetical protein [Vagococcus]|uniref:Exfoliative toxin A n=1 Tax=Vagococcus fluvialis bH819 TaxID=1255619 RepID=A0A1X6WQ53_9ENTE|nr:MULTISPECIES: hypothetical protein [Vagococcus]SLM86388.1 Exfoliative toxin A [Vagococcus fluvialis bH819]HCM89043.1 hypothetical protein [Vagococcus sp.]